MIVLKSKAEIALMRHAGRVLARVLRRMAEMGSPGVTTQEMDREADRIIREAGCEATFKGQPGMVDNAPPYPAATCISLNEQIIHGIPSDRVLEPGDLVSVDCGVTYKGMIADAAVSFIVGGADKADREIVELMEVTRQSLDDAIRAARPGRHLHDISFAVQARISTTDFGIVREFCGHGVGRDLHEDPPIPNYGTPGTGPTLRPGMTLAIEPMVTLGSPRIEVLDDGWTVVTRDRGHAAHFEHTIVITDGGAEILTAHP